MPDKYHNDSLNSPIRGLGTFTVLMLAGIGYATWKTSGALLIGGLLFYLGLMKLIVNGPEPPMVL